MNDLLQLMLIIAPALALDLWFQRPEVGAGRARDYAVEAPGRRVEAPHVAAPQEIGAAHDAKARLLETTPEKIDARKKRENEGR